MRPAALALRSRCALRRDGANVIVAAKTTEPHPQLPGTIRTAAEAIERAGGHALPIALDIRDDAAVHAAAKQAADTFGGIDILVNNASAISLTGTLATPMKRFDLMFAVNVRGVLLLLAGLPSRICKQAATQSAHPDACRRRST